MKFYTVYAPYCKPLRDTKMNSSNYDTRGTPAYLQIDTLERMLSRQEDHNEKLQAEVDHLREKVTALQYALFNVTQSSWGYEDEP